MNSRRALVERAALDPLRRATDARPMSLATGSDSGSLSAPPAVASFSRRAAAYALDVLIAGVAIQLVQWTLLFTWGDARERLDGGREWFAYLWLSASAPVYAYFILSESSRRRATLGKHALGLVVGDGYGAPIGLRAAVIRTVVKLAPWDLAHLVLCFPAPPWDGGPAFELRRGIFAVYALLAINLATTLMTRKQQSVHDLAAGTLVLRAPPKGSLPGSVAGSPPPARA
jgi:uncharacterized RDD family membrane protein YckC